jgi:hypothetical protein
MIGIGEVEKNPGWQDFNEKPRIHAIPPEGFEGFELQRGHVQLGFESWGEQLRPIGLRLPETGRS